VRTCRPSVRRENQHCNDSDAKNDIGALCRQLLKAHGIHRQLKAALYVSKQAHLIPVLCIIIIIIIIIILKPTSTKPQAEILTLNKVNGCNEIIIIIINQWTFIIIVCMLLPKRKTVNKDALYY